MSSPKRSKSRDRARRIVAAVRELHEAAYDAWSYGDDAALGAAYQKLESMYDRTIKGGGKVIDGWSGGPAEQFEAIGESLRYLQTYDAEAYTPTGDRNGQ